MGSRSWRRLTVATSVLAMAATLLSSPAAVAAAPAQPTPPQARTSLAPGTLDLTLVTGDRLRLATRGDGRFDVEVTHVASRGRGVPLPTIEVVSVGDAVLALPSDLRQAILTGEVDRGLFDLATLARQGLADANAEALPLIVRGGALPAGTTARALPTLGASAVSVPKATTGEFWAAARAGGAQVWLDGTAELSLDVSVPLVGAPAAWEAGLDGTGTTVAVLDSGVDLNHPDLAGRIGATESFIPGETVQDTHGHGTHVATTVAGSGAASGGAYRGVAPGATLMIGKVCDNDGCPYSSIIAGMEWAAAGGADVVSMSLGGPATDGSDVLSQTVNTLTESTGTLFVIAAGNAGPGAETIGTPAAADAALAVANTTKSDALAGSSSRGPRLDGALKPEISGPGTSIVAGRAAGTAMGTPVDEHYTSATGTSMATPHVSGAAAILAQRHPDWTAGQLKAALMSTAKDVGFSAYEVGAGRLDVAAAVATGVFAETTMVDYGNLNPGENPDPVRREIRYTNLGDTPVTLDLTHHLGRVGGDPVGDAFTGDPQVTVPAHGSATASVSLDLTGLADGRYSGAVTATADGVSLRTPVGLDRQPPKTKLTLRLVDHDGGEVCGQCSHAELVAVDVPDTDFLMFTQVGAGLYEAWVREGTYSVSASVHFMNPTTSADSMALLIDPEVAVDGPTEVTLDARTAKEVRMRTDKPGVPVAQALTWARSRWDGQLITSVQAGSGGQMPNHVLVGGSTEKVRTGRFHFSVARLLLNPQITMRVAGRNGFDLTIHSRGYSDGGQVMYADGDWVPWAATRRKVDVVDAGYGRPEDLAGVDLRGKLAVLRWGDDRYGDDIGTPPDGIPDSFIWTDRVTALKDAGAIGYLAVSAPPAGWEEHASFNTPTEFIMPGTPLPEVQILRDEGLRLLSALRRGRVQIDLTVDPNVRNTQQLFPSHDRVPASVDYRFDRRQLSEVDTALHGTTPLPVNGSFAVFSATQSFGGAASATTLSPAERTEYFGPTGQDVTVRQTRSRQGGAIQNINAFPDAGRSSDRWFTPVIAPGVLNLGAAEHLQDQSSRSIWFFCQMCREGDLLWPHTTRGIGDGNKAAGISYSASHLYQEDGTEIPATPVTEIANLPGYRLPADPQTYRLVLEENGGATTTWRFHSSRPTTHSWKAGSPCALRQVGGTDPCAPQPMVFLGYDLGDSLRLNNTVHAGRHHEFTVHAYHPPSQAKMPAIAGLRLWTSTDNGKTWQPAEIDRNRNGTFTAQPDYPRHTTPTSTVSIKAEAWDTQGNRIDQLLPNAYQLAPR